MKRLKIYITFLTAINLVCILPSLGQDINGSITDAFTETIWLSTERELFLSGEEVEFSARLFEADSYNKSSLSKIIRAELIGAGQNIISRKSYRVKDGKLVGSFKLPQNLTGGWYHIRAYTNWMRNRPSLNRSIISFRVINPSDINEPGILEKHDSVNIKITSLDGKIYYGMDNECSIHVETANGTPVESQCYILANSKDTVATVHTDRSGWGYFKWSPGEETDSYSVSAKGYMVGRTIMPDIENGQPVFSFSRTGYNLVITFNPGNNNPPGDIELLVHGIYSQYWYDTADSQNREITFRVPLNRLPERVMQFSLLSNRRPLARFLWYGGDIIDYTEQIIISSDDEQSRGDRTVSFAYSGRNEEDIINLYSVIKKAEPGSSMDVFVPGLPGWLADNSIPLKEEARKGWIIANSYPDSILERFISELSESDRYSTPDINTMVYEREMQADYLPETRGYTISGKVSDSNGQPIPSIALGLTILNDNSFYCSSTFKNGKFYFNLSGRTGSEDMVLGFIQKPDPGWIIETDSPWTSLDSSIADPGFYLSDEEIIYVRDLLLKRQLREIYIESIDSIKRNEATIERRKVFFGEPDISVVIEDFIKLPNIYEVIFEVLPGISVRKSGEDEIIKVSGEYEFPPQYRPLILLDGIPIYDFEEFLRFSPSRIEKIEAKKKLYVYGNVIFAGIINIITLHGDLAGLDLPAESILMTTNFPIDYMVSTRNAFSGMEIESPMLTNTPYRDFDFKSDNNKINYNIGRNPGDYRFVVWGFNSEGRYIYGYRELD